MQHTLRETCEWEKEKNGKKITSMKHFFTSLFSFVCFTFAVMESLRLMRTVDDVKIHIVMMCVFIDIWPKEKRVEDPKHV